MPNRTIRKWRILLSFVSACSVSNGCQPNINDTILEETIEIEPGLSKESAFTSNQATLMVAEFKSELIIYENPTYVRPYVKTQLLYLIGQLNAFNSAPQLEKMVLPTLTRQSLSGNRTRVVYSAQIPVGWGNKINIPDKLTFTLPARVDETGLKNFTNTYKTQCSEDPDATTPDNMWYHYRPQQEGCALKPEDVQITTATLKLSPDNTQKKYPEYDKIWKDNVLRMLVIFGKYKDGATEDSDAGITVYNEFYQKMKDYLNADMTPPLSGPPGVKNSRVTYQYTIDDKHKIEVNAVLIDSPKSATSEFAKYYADKAKTADVIIYGGHAGLGANVRALVKMTPGVTGQYRLVFVDGCDSFAYLDSTLHQNTASANRDDPKGTKYLDVMANLMPSYFYTMPTMVYNMMWAMSQYAAPLQFDEVMALFDKAGVVVATGEEDNTFKP